MGLYHFNFTQGDADVWPIRLNTTAGVYLATAFTCSKWLCLVQDTSLHKYLPICDEIFLITTETEVGFLICGAICCKLNSNY